MGTNFYLVQKLPEHKKNTIIQLIKEDKYKEAKKEIPEPIHIGKRSGGWKFLWNAHEFEYFSPNKESLIEWLKSGEIVNEYDEKFTFDQFWNEELVLEGCDLNEYYEILSTPSVYVYYAGSEIITKYKENWDINVDKYGEFYIDNLRFTTFTEFS